MPVPEYPDEPFRPRLFNVQNLYRLAVINRRTPTAEAQLAIDTHIAANRALLKNGPKLRKP